MQDSMSRNFIITMVKSMRYGKQEDKLQHVFHVLDGSIKTGFVQVQKCTRKINWAFEIRSVVYINKYIYIYANARIEKNV